MNKYLLNNRKIIPFPVSVDWRCNAAGALLVCLLAACGGAPEEQVAETSTARALVIYTVNYPLAYFAERIGGDEVEVVLPVPDGTDPAFWQPTATDILGYQAADLILLNGAGYAKWLSRASLPSAALLDTSAAFKDRLIAVSGNVRHRHGPEGAHDHGEVAFTIWLEPELAAMQIESIRLAMTAARPELEAVFARRSDALLNDMAELDAAVAQAFAALGDAGIVFSHPVYQYLARGMGITGQSVMWEPDQSLAEADLQALVPVAANGERLNIVIWEAEPLPENRATLKALGFESLVFSPLANRPESGDYLIGMQENARQLARVGNPVSSTQGHLND